MQTNRRNFLFAFATSTVALLSGSKVVAQSVAIPMPPPGPLGVYTFTTALPKAPVNLNPGTAIVNNINGKCKVAFVRLMPSSLAENKTQFPDKTFLILPDTEVVCQTGPNDSWTNTFFLDTKAKTLYLRGVHGDRVNCEGAIFYG